MLSLSPLAVASSLPARQTSAQKAFQQIDPKIRTGREEVLTDLFTALRTWRVNPKTYTQDKISPALKERIRALKSSSTQLQSILQVALKFANANEGKFTSNEALILAIEQELKGLEKSIESKKPRSSFCKLFFSVTKVAALGTMLLGAGLYAHNTINASSSVVESNRIPAFRLARFQHCDEKPAFFKGDLLVDEQGGKPLYCPPNARIACRWYVDWTQSILHTPNTILPENPYVKKAGGTIYQITFKGQPISVAPGGELPAVRYIEKLSQANPDSLGRPASNFTALRERIRSLWPDATDSPLKGNF